MQKILTIVLLLMCHLAPTTPGQQAGGVTAGELSLQGVTRYFKYNNGTVFPRGGSGGSVYLTGVGGRWPGAPFVAPPDSIPLKNIFDKFQADVKFPDYHREWFHPVGEPLFYNMMLSEAWARNTFLSVKSNYLKEPDGFQFANVEHMRTWVVARNPVDFSRTALLRITRKLTVDGGSPEIRESFVSVIVPADAIHSRPVDLKPGKLTKLVNNAVVETFFEGKYLEEISVSLLPVEVRVTDVTGFRGIGSTPASAVPRIPLTKDADGIACDWRDDVEDGAMLLIRFVAPSGQELSVEFGRHDPGFVAGLPTGPARDGEYIEVNSTDEGHLRDLGLKLKGEEFENGRTVYAMRLYKPASEFDLTTPQSPQKSRELKLAVKATGTGGSTGLEIDMERTLTLTRPPLVLVHGVNSGPAAWQSFSDKFENDWGFVCRNFRVDHSGVDSTRPAELSTEGFGEISTTCLKVRDMVSEAKSHFHNRSYFDKRIAVQKVDVVAHSYGGLLTRWYTEMAGNPEGSEFADRRDVRKLITLGTPHKGSPLANMVCEVFANPLIADASAEGVGSLELSMFNLLGRLDVEGIGTGLSTGQLPTALTSARTEPRHAYQIFTVNSQRLATLNATPLHEDIGYAAVTGTQDNMYGAVDFKTLVPNRDTFIPGDAKPYFPWIDYFIRDGVDLDGTDAIVPKWSSKISGITNDYFEVAANHVELTGDTDVMAKCREWLNRKLSRGAEHRTTWVTVPVSERNAYKGSIIGAGGTSIGGGLRSTAIVKVELNAGSTGPFTLSTDAATVGIKDATLTGMIKVSSIGTESFALVADEALDDVLNNVGAPNASALNISPADMAGTGAAHYVPFELKNVKYGRLHDNQASGPHGESDDEDTVLIGYELDGEPGQAPPVELVLPDYFLEPPAKTGMVLRLKGAIDVSGAGSGSQSVETRVYDNDSVTPDDLLETSVFTLTHPAGAWNDVLIPYTTDVTLFIDGSGDVAGSQGSSGENPAQVFQHLVRPGMSSNPESTNVDVP